MMLTNFEEHVNSFISETNGWYFDKVQDEEGDVCYRLFDPFGDQNGDAFYDFEDLLDYIVQDDIISDRIAELISLTHD